MSDDLWTRIEVVLRSQSSEEEIDLLSSILFDLGAQGLEVLDAERPVSVVAAFPPEVEPSGLDQLVRDALAEHGVPPDDVSQRTFESIDWSTHWRRHFEPLAFGRLWVVPTWLEPPEEAVEVLWIDPSSAFGTGLHATTALCLERVVELSPVPSFLDVGTGTGILALAAKKLGTLCAAGVDNDPDALVVAEENARKNDIEGFQLSGEIPNETFSLVVANILAKPLIDLAPAVARAVAPSGRLLLSGVLDVQADEVIAAYEARGMQRDRTTNRDEWVLIEMIPSLRSRR